MAQLNYHHLHYFHAIAQAGGLTKAAEMLNVSPSALSVQLQQLEHQLGHALFERRGRQLVLTEAGHVAFERAEKIFETGRELVDALSGASLQRQKLVRVGALSTLSRNFQIEFLRPLMGLADTQIQLRSGALRDLMRAMEDHQLDIVLTNTLPARDAQSGWTPHIISDQTLSLIGERAPRTRSKPLNELLATKPLILPTAETHMRAEFDAYVVRKGIKPLIAAEVDDMAMLRLMAREGAGFAVAPPIVLRDELNEGLLHDYGALGDLREVFYAITPVRRFSHLLVASLLPGADKSSKPTRTRD